MYILSLVHGRLRSLCVRRCTKPLKQVRPDLISVIAVLEYFFAGFGWVGQTQLLAGVDNLSVLPRTIEAPIKNIDSAIGTLHS